jgi:signal transduction histidine kinase
MAHKKVLGILVIVLFIVTGPTFAGTVNEQQVIEIVTKTSSDISENAKGTFEKIINGEHPYRNKDNEAFYVFVYDSGVIIVAHPKKTLVGKCYKGKPDVKGKKFRDEIVKSALENKTGWVEYFYTKPGEKGIHKKKTYYKFTTGSDGGKYVVCCGMYAD